MHLSLIKYCPLLSICFISRSLHLNHFKVLHNFLHNFVSVGFARITPYSTSTYGLQIAIIKSHLICFQCNMFYKISTVRIWKYINPKVSISYKGEARMGYGTLGVDLFIYPDKQHGICFISHPIITLYIYNAF